jgi:hypothetical protein
VNADARVDLVLRLHEARNARDNDTTLELVSPEMEIHYRLGIPAFRGDWVGMRPEEGSAMLFGVILWNIMGGGSGRLRTLDARLVGEELVLCHSEMTFTVEDVDYPIAVAQIFRVGGGRIFELYDHPDPVEPGSPLALEGERAVAELREVRKRAGA